MKNKDIENPNKGYEYNPEFMAEIHMKAGKPEEALEDFKKTGLNEKESYKKLGDAYFSANNYSSAVYFYEKGEIEGEKLIKARKKIGDRLLEKGYYGYAAGVYEKAGIDSKDISQKIGDKAVEDGYYGDAIEWYEKEGLTKKLEEAKKLFNKK